MGDFFVYMLKSAACLVVFYLFFRLLMNRDTFHRFNRIAVLCILVLSVIVPFCNMHMDTQTQVNQAVLELHQLFVEPSITVVTQPDHSLTWIHVLLLVYLFGVIFFICRNIYILMRIRRLIQQSKIEKLKDRIKLVICDSTISPFSWMNYIVISEIDLKENGKEIITHEMAHVRKRHSMDILLADICVAFQWFNPAIWLVKQELQNIHEYEADEYVLKEGIDAKHYQILLIKKAVGKRLYSMANSFNHSKLKKRITMMSKQKSSPWGRLKYLYVLPVTVVAITAFARPEISSELNKISEVKVSDFVEMAKANDVVKKDLPTSDTNEEFVMTNIPIEKSEKAGISKESSAQANNDEDYVMTNIPINESVTKSVSGIVKDSSGNPIVGAAVVIVGSTTGTITDTDGKFTIEVPDDAILSVSMIDMKTVTAKVDKSNYLTITLPSQTSDKKTTVALSYPSDVVVVGRSGSAQTKRPLVIVDGKKKSDGISNLEPQDIVNLNVLQKEEAVKQYGTEGENGVIIVTTKNK